MIAIYCECVGAILDHSRLYRKIVNSMDTFVRFSGKPSCHLAKPSHRFLRRFRSAVHSSPNNSSSTCCGTVWEPFSHFWSPAYLAISRPNLWWNLRVQSKNTPSRCLCTLRRALCLRQCRWGIFRRDPTPSHPRTSNKRRASLAQWP